MLGLVVSALAFAGSTPSAADEGTDAYCQALDDYARATAEAGNADDADVTSELRALAATGLAALEDLPEAVASGNLDASVEFCGIDLPDRVVPDREQLVQFLTDVVGASEPEATCLADGLTSEFDDEALVTIRFGGLRSMSDDATDRYLRLVVACLADPVLAASPVAPVAVVPTPLTAEERRAREQSAEVLDHRMFASFTGWSLADHAGSAVTVENGVRVSSPPPASEAEPLDVWFFGGNAVFGPAQRDGATVPSWFGIFGAAAGATLAMQNFGVPGFSNYQETVALADRLAQGSQPDLAVFYDGFEDLELVLGAAFAGLPFRNGATHWQAATFADVIAAARGRAAVTDGRGLLGRIDVDLTADQAVSDAADALAGSVELGEVLSSTYGLRVAHVWVPNIHTKVLLPAEAALLPSLGLGGGRAAVWRSLAADLRRQLPGSVIDLSSALDTVPTPTLVDGSSTTEAGASAMAEAVAQALGPLTAAAPSGGAP